MKLTTYSFNAVKSTNDIAFKKIKKNNFIGAIISNKQSHGRGRYGKKWISIKGNLFMTVFFKINKRIKLRSITNINCIIIKKAISKYLDKKIVIKWPNDLLVENKKICGILQETFFNNKNKFMVVGIGVNILDSPKISKYETTYINKYSKKKVDKMLVFRSIKLMFEKNLNKFKN